MTWLKANRWYLVALVALVPAAVLVALSGGWWDYVEAENGRPIEVSGAETVEYGGAQWSLTEWHSFSADTDAGVAADLLPGTTLVTATIGVRPGAEPPGCEIKLTDASGERQWDQASYSETSFEISDRAENYCATDAEEPYLVQVYFVIPDDAATHPRLRLSVASVYPTLLSFEL